MVVLVSYFYFKVLVPSWLRIEMHSLAELVMARIVQRSYQIMNECPVIPQYENFRTTAFDNACERKLPSD
eukprot:2249587-Amphidinium_carterae.1